jgi:predicted MPP superfamily phosphohydrolase
MSRPTLPVPPAVALAVVAVVLAALHAPLWLRVVAPAGLPEPATAGAAAMFTTGAAATFGAFARRFVALPVPATAVTVGWAWLGLVFFGSAAVVATEPVRWLGGEDATRWLAQGLAVAIPTVGLAGFARARTPTVTRVEVPLAGLPAALDGFTLAQISDVHVGHTPRALVQWIVDTVNRHEVDLVAVTGDLVEGTVSEIGADVAVLRGLRSRHGTFLVTGNHEYFAGVGAWLPFLEGLGIRVLRNEAVTIGAPGAAFALLGVDDRFGRLVPGHGEDLPRAAAAAAPGLLRVLLAHQPVTVDRAADHGVALQLSGHTHGGQIQPFGLLVRLVQPYLGGLVNHRGTWLYVHQGTGHWGPPLRVGTRGELALITLRTGSPRAA